MKCDAEMQFLGPAEPHLFIFPLHLLKAIMCCWNNDLRTAVNREHKDFGHLFKVFFFICFAEFSVGINSMLPI